MSRFDEGVPTGLVAGGEVVDPTDPLIGLSGSMIDPAADEPGPATCHPPADDR